MDTGNLRKNHSKLIAYMKSSEYNRSYVKRMVCEIKQILLIADSQDISSYADIYQGYVQKNLSKAMLADKRVILGAIEQFDLFGLYPDGTPKQAYLQRGAYLNLCPEYKAVVDYYKGMANKEGKKESTIRTQVNSASGFFLTLQQSGILRLEDISEKDVLDAFREPNDGTIMRKSYRRSLPKFLKTCLSKYPICEKIQAFLPTFRRRQKNIQYLTKEESSKIKNVLLGNESSLTLRDKAIGILAFYIGLRGCDIVGITMDSIDWKNDLLHIHQQKTQVPIVLPLTTIVGNAIYDYITMERPETECEHVFISQNRPFGRIQGGPTTSKISYRIMNAAGIRQEPGNSRGMHIFRHHLATSLLSEGTPRPVISNIVGHTSPRSLCSYLSADFHNLKKCAISIERFPMAKEVFAI